MMTPTINFGHFQITRFDAVRKTSTVIFSEWFIKYEEINLYSETCSQPIHKTLDQGISWSRPVWFGWVGIKDSTLLRKILIFIKIVFVQVSSFSRFQNLWNSCLKMQGFLRYDAWCINKIWFWLYNSKQRCILVPNRSQCSLRRFWFEGKWIDSYVVNCNHNRLLNDTDQG